MTPKEQFIDDLFNTFDHMLYITVHSAKDPTNEKAADFFHKSGKETMDAFIEKWSPKGDS